MKLAAVCLLVACTRPAPAPPHPPLKPDSHSFANPMQVAVKHLSLELAVDFGARVTRGVAKLTVERYDPKAPLRLDTDDLAIGEVTTCGGERLVTSFEPAHPNLGRALVVTLPAKGDCVAIRYETRPDAHAFLWVEPSGTAGGVHPMLFTQSQSTHARSWIPLQDTPGVRFTYDAAIRVPAGLRAAMSAENPAKLGADGAWHFRMPQPIPSYLMALAVGDLAFRPIGSRAGVYAEPSVVEAAASELVEMPAMIAAAEKLYGPYRWGRYDVLVLPSSFPYGGMENPRLTFLTPTVITGDRSLVSLIAHELAHSWSGNLVTGSTWQDFWLNEGFTTYVEGRIMEELRGRDEAQLLWYQSHRDFVEQLAESPGDPDSRLALDYGAERAPDEVPGYAAYNKGAMLLRELEHAVGRAKFDAFLRSWFDRHAFQSTDSATFEAFAAPAFPGFDFATWIHKPGLPTLAAPTDSALAAKLEHEAATFVATGTLPDTARWTTQQWVVFLQGLPADTPRLRLAVLDDRHHLTGSTNAELGMFWLPMLVRADMREAAPAIEKFLVRIGRRRMVQPLYEAMLAWSGYWHDLASTIFARAKPGYHPIVRAAVERLLSR